MPWLLLLHEPLILRHLLWEGTIHLWLLTRRLKVLGRVLHLATWHWRLLHHWIRHWRGTRLEEVWLLRLLQELLLRLRLPGCS